MIGEYRTAKGWRIFIYIFGPLMIALFIFLFFMPFVQDGFDVAAALFFFPISLGMIALFIYGLIDTIKGKFIIETDKLVLKNPLGTRTLKFKEIKGYRTDNNYIYIIPVSGQQKKIKVSTYTERSEGIIAWLSTMFPELDAREKVEEETKILESQEYGITRQSREYRLNEARRVARITNAVSFVLFLWITFYPRPYTISLSIGIVYPIVILLILFFYRGLLRMEEKKNSPYPSVLTGFIMAGLGLTLRALLDFNILEYGRLWITISVLSAILFLLVIVTTGEFKLKKIEDYFSIVGLMVSLFSYTFGGYTLANCIYDRSKPQLFKCEVIDKEMSSEKTTAYYLQITPWKQETEIEKVKVSGEKYNAIAAGDYVTVYEMEGFFKTPWFFVVLE